ncbi:MAG: hypothetical protein ACKOGF_05085, partial [Candidatus Limnocylindrus sp.]
MASITGGSLLLAALAGAGVVALSAGLLLLSLGLIGLNGASAHQRNLDTPEWSWRGPGPMATFWSVLPLAIIAPTPLLLLAEPLGGFEQLDPAVATLGIALSTNLATTLVVALTVVGTGAASWRAI